MRSACARRSVLYVPAVNAKALAKLPALSADAVIVDCEDSVAPERKDEARAVLAGLPRPRGELVIRVNGPATEWFGEDMAAALAARPDAVLVPKVDHPSDLRAAVDRIADVDEPPRLWAMIETAKSILNIREIAEFCANPGNRTDCFVLGTNDLANELGLRGPARALLRPALLQALLAARAAGLDLIDGVFNDFSDAAGFAAECADAAALGLDGKSLIHPAQIAAANAAFSPSPDEVASAESIVAAFTRPENAGRGVISLDGKMVERLHLAQAERLLARAGKPISPFAGLAAAHGVENDRTPTPDPSPQGVTGGGQSVRISAASSDNLSTPENGGIAAGAAHHKEPSP